MWRIKSVDALLATAEKKSLHRSLGPVQLILLGVGGVIGTGIFVLTAEAAQKSGPGMMLAFSIAGTVSAMAALCYAELAAMVPVSGSAYTYSYAVLGEVVAWLVGWALILEYAVAASAVSVGWSGYMVGLLANSTWHIVVPHALAAGPYAGGVVNLLAVVVALGVTGLLVAGTRESANVNAVLVAVKLAALALFIWLTLPAAHAANFHPFMPRGGGGIIAAAASIFFAYIGFDGVSTAAEETHNPQKNLPIGLIGSLAICTVVYLLVAAGVIGTTGAQPLFGAHGEILEPGSMSLATRCAGMATEPLVCSREALAQVLRFIHQPVAGYLVGLAAGVALPTVVLMTIYGQTRVCFAMSRDGLLPEVLSRVHSRFHTPHVVTWISGVAVAIAAAFLPVGQLADISNSGTLFAFAMVSVAVLVLRRTQPGRTRPFRMPLPWVFAPLACAGCGLLFVFLSWQALLLFMVWSAVGLIFYFAYGYRRSHVARGITG